MNSSPLVIFIPPRHRCDKLRSLVRLHGAHLSESLGIVIDLCRAESRIRAQHLNVGQLHMVLHHDHIERRLGDAILGRISATMR